MLIVGHEQYFKPSLRRPLGESPSFASSFDETLTTADSLPPACWTVPATPSHKSTPSARHFGVLICGHSSGGSDCWEPESPHVADDWAPGAHGPAAHCWQPALIQCVRALLTAHPSLLSPGDPAVDLPMQLVAGLVWMPLLLWMGCCIHPQLAVLICLNCGSVWLANEIIAHLCGHDFSSLTPEEHVELEDLCLEHVLAISRSQVSVPIFGLWLIPGLNIQEGLYCWAGGHSYTCCKGSTMHKHFSTHHPGLQWDCQSGLCTVQTVFAWALCNFFKVDELLVEMAPGSHLEAYKTAYSPILDTPTTVVAHSADPHDHTDGVSHRVVDGVERLCSLLCLTHYTRRQATGPDCLHAIVHAYQTAINKLASLAMPHIQFMIVEFPWNPEGKLWTAHGENAAGWTHACTIQECMAFALCTSEGPGLQTAYRFQFTAFQREWLDTYLVHLNLNCSRSDDDTAIVLTFHEFILCFLLALAAGLLSPEEAVLEHP
ncbi:hypothetical protein C8J57DRAFT_1250759 [Mycena rebaudengoi]|nr:hypothetical protein C8J57DRAFT_1250759 [Mycena rebaudengoi]